MQEQTSRDWDWEFVGETFAAPRQAAGVAAGLTAEETLVASFVHTQ